MDAADSVRTAKGKHWLLSASPLQRRALLAASLGWMLDSMDVMLYALVLPQAQKDLHMSTAVGGLLMSLTLISAAAGGITFGWLADRIGRARALMASILIYSIFTGACGFVHTVVQLAVCRILLGIGMGGEWAAGAALVAETWPDEHRGKALAVVQSSWAVGYALGAAITALVMPHFGWRAVFFVGVIPALITLWIRRRVKEPEIWREKKTKSGPGLRVIFRGELGRRTLIATSMNAATLFAWWGLFFWIPGFLSMPASQGGRGLTVVQTSTWTILMQVGTFLGYISFGFFADRFGRKRTYISYLVMAAIVVPIYAHIQNDIVLLCVGPLVGFFGSGYFSGFGVISSELFPTAVRATAMGFTYNFGRILSAAAPFAVGRISEHSGLGGALSITSFGFLLAAILACGLTETRGKSLE